MTERVVVFFFKKILRSNILSLFFSRHFFFHATALLILTNIQPEFTFYHFTF